MWNGVQVYHLQKWQVPCHTIRFAKVSLLMQAFSRSLLILSKVDLSATSVMHGINRSWWSVVTDCSIEHTLIQIDGEINVLVLPPSLEAAAVKTAHQNTGHGNWETMCRLLSQHAFFLVWPRYVRSM